MQEPDNEPLDEYGQLLEETGLHDEHAEVSLTILPAEELSSQVHVYPPGDRKQDVALKFSEQHCGGTARVIVGTCMLSLLSWVMYVMLTKPSPGVFDYICTGLVTLMTLAFTAVLVTGIWRLVAQSKTQMPLVRFQVTPVYLGEKFQAHFSQTLKRKADVQEVQIQIVCRHGKVSYSRANQEARGSKDVHVNHNDIFTSESVHPFTQIVSGGEKIEFEFQGHVPSNALPSLRIGSKSNQSIEWLIKTRTCLNGWPDAVAEFEFSVKGPPADVNG